MKGFREFRSGRYTTAGALLVTALTVVLAVIAPANAEAASAGRAQIVKPTDGTPLNSGGSPTPFAVAFSTSARCPGDSTEPPWYRAYSYLVPQGTSPTAVNFKTGRPSRWFGLYSFLTYYANNVAKGTGQVGPVVPGNLTFTPLPVSALIPHGAQRAVWEAGVACAGLDGSVASYWNVEIAFTASASDPKGYVWTVTHHVSSSRGSLGFDLAGLAVALALAVLAVRLVTHRPARSDSAVRDA